MTSQRQTTLFEDILLDADKLAAGYDDNCQWLVALSDWQITVILSLMRYAEWPSRWLLGGHTWDEVSAKISELEYCLMSGCNVSDLIKTQRLLIAAITGTSVDLDSDLPTGTVDYADYGLASTLRHDNRGLAQIIDEYISKDSEEKGVTLNEYLEFFDDDDKQDYAPVYLLMKALQDILPDEMGDEYLIADPAKFTLEAIYDIASFSSNVANTAIGAITAGAESGELATEAAKIAVTSIDTIISGISAGALSLSAIIDVLGLFQGKDTDPDVRTMTRVYNDVFVEGDAINVSCAPDVTVNCGGGGGGGGMGTPGDGGLGGTFEPIIVDPDEEFPIDQDKCNRITYIADNFIIHIQNVAGIATITDIGFAVGSGFFLNATPLVFTSLAIAGTAVLLAYMVIGAIIGGFVGSAVMLAWASDLEDAKEDFICAAYNASTASGFVSAVRDWIEATIPTIGIPWTDKYVEFVSGGGVAAWVLTGEGFTPPETLPVGDCGACGGGETMEWHFLDTLHGFTAFITGRTISNDNSLVIPAVTDRTEQGVFGTDWVPFKNGTIIPPGNYDYDMIGVNTDFWAYGLFGIWIKEGTTYVPKVSVRPQGLSTHVTGTFNVEETDGELILGLYCGVPDETYWTKLDYLKLTPSA